MKNFPKSAFAIIRVGIVVLLLIPLIYSANQRWISVRATLTTANWELIVAGIFILMLAQPLMGLISWIILRDLNQCFSYLRILLIYFASQAAKYLPGGIWAFPGRAVAYQAIGVEKPASIISMLREVSVLFLGAAVVGLFGLFRGLPIAEWVRAAIIVGVAICTVVIGLAQLPMAWHFLSKISMFKNIDKAESEINRSGFRWLPLTLIASLAFWLITGIAFRTMAIGVTPDAANISWLQAASIFSLAWCAGFVVVFAPAGLGVRESALSGLLLSYMPLGDALSVALIARLWWTVAEGVLIAFSIIRVAGTKGHLIGGPKKDF